VRGLPLFPFRESFSFSEAPEESPKESSEMFPLWPCTCGLQDDSSTFCLTEAVLELSSSKSEKENIKNKNKDLNVYKEE